MPEVVIRAQHLRKVFHQGFWRKRVEAVQGVSFEVKRGQIYGFLGPNGAGKTTTIKMLTGLIAPTEGEAEIFGLSVRNPAARARVGFLPENPYVYPYLTPREFVELCARLSGMSGKAVRTGAEKAMDRVGILYAADRAVRKLSKGMLQRTGLAGALVADPELLILDEPMSGLDPVGRKDVRDVILDERARGRTVFFSTHILGDVEMLCDHVTILRKGVAVVSGNLSELLRRDVQRTDVTLVGNVPAFDQWCREKGLTARRDGERLEIAVEGAERLAEIVKRAVDDALVVVEVRPRSETLEDLFLREAIAEKVA